MDELEDLKVGTNNKVKSGTAQEREEIISRYRLRQGVLLKKYYA